MPGVRACAGRRVTVLYVLTGAVCFYAGFVCAAVLIKRRRTEGVGGKRYGS